MSNRKKKTHQYPKNPLTPPNLLVGFHGVAIQVPRIGAWKFTNSDRTNPWILREPQHTPGTYPQTPNQQFMKEFLSFGAFGMAGVCSRGMLENS